MNLLFKRVKPNAVLPTKAYPGDAGWDLYNLDAIWIPPRSTRWLWTGIATAIPDGFHGAIVTRSSTWKTLRLMVMTTRIDAGFRGELAVVVWNPSLWRWRRIPSSRRVGQLVVVSTPEMTATEVDELPASERGTCGVGSSGL